jgi:hypothetical protein
VRCEVGKFTLASLARRNKDLVNPGWQAHLEGLHVKKGKIQILKTTPLGFFPAHYYSW